MNIDKKTYLCMDTFVHFTIFTVNDNFLYMMIRLKISCQQDI